MQRDCMDRNQTIPSHRSNGRKVRGFPRMSRVTEEGDCGEGSSVAAWRQRRSHADAATEPSDSVPRQRTRTTPVLLRRNLTYVHLTPRLLKEGLISRTGSYSFHLLKDNGRSVSSATMVDDFACPFCGFECQALQHAWIHWNTLHAHEYWFDHRTTPDQRLHILAKPRSGHLEPEERPGALESELLFVETCCRYAQRPSLRGTMKGIDLITHCAPKNVEFPKRSYYHPETGCVITLGQWLHGTEGRMLDSDWRRDMEDELIDDFTDVTPMEKLFMKLWNGFLGDHETLVCDIASKLMDFVDQSATMIQEQGLYYEFLSHLTVMWHHGHLTRQLLHRLCERYNERTVKDIDSGRTMVCMTVTGQKRKFSQIRNSSVE